MLEHSIMSTSLENINGAIQPLADPPGFQAQAEMVKDYFRKQEKKHLNKLQKRLQIYFNHGFDFSEERE